MSHVSSWQRLGIERTDDVTAIKRAYAKRLKETDVEADPRAFISLREARDFALEFARSPAPAALDDPEPFDWDDEPDFAGQDDWLISPAPDARSAPADPRAFAEAEARRARFEELQSLLFADDPRPGAPERMRVLVREMLADPEMLGLTNAERVEAWLAWAAAASEPRSDPILPLVVEHFGWERKFEDWDLDYSIIAAVQRYRALLFREVALPPGSPYHEAWMELTRTEDRLGWDRYLAAGRVAKLLTIVRDHCPAAEDLLNPHRVALWDEHLEASVKRYMTVAVFVFGAAFLALRFGSFAS